MPARIRLQRYGKKGKPFYHIVIADGRAPRDGKYIENIGTYNPITTPATIELNIESAVKWLKNGATPSDTAKAILSYKGVLYKYHLEKGVAKGALTPEQAEAKFNQWLTEKEDKITAKAKSLEVAQKDARKKSLSKEREVNEAREKEYMAKMAKLAEKENKAKAALEGAPIEEEPATIEEPVAEETAPVAEVEEATPVAEVEEVAPVAEVEEVAPVAEIEEVAPVAEVEATPEVLAETTPEQETTEETQEEPKKEV